MAQKNLLPQFTYWEISEGTESSEVASSLQISEDGYGCSFTITNESSYVYYNVPVDNILGHTLILSFSEFQASDNEGWISVRLYDSAKDTYTSIDQYSKEILYPFKLEIPVPGDCGRLRVYVRHEWASKGIDPPATISIKDIMLYDTYTESLTALNFHKVLEANLPTQVTPGSQHIYFTTDGSTVKQYISNKEGYLIPVNSSSSTGDAEEEYYNAYTQQWIDERKQEIVDLTRQGHCIVFAIATDIHVRIEDGDSGRYNQVRDFIMLSKQLPLDYVCCLGDIMSYCQNWDGIYEPRIEAVKDIFIHLRCPWWCVRGNHDYNSDDNGVESNTNMAEFNESTADQLFITNHDWHKSITSNFPQPVGYDVRFDESHVQYGYFYVDDYAHKHRLIFLNSEETHEDEYGRPYKEPGGSLDCIISGIYTEHQVQWLINEAMDMTNKTNWAVSFFSHTVPYTDAEEEDHSEFHGYGGDNPFLRQIIKAFQNGEKIENLSYSVLNTVTHEWYGLDINKDFTSQGPISVIGYFGGHCHDDCYKNVDGLNINISTCTCSNQRTDWTNDPSPQKLPPERNSSNLAMSVNVFIVNADTRTVNMIKIGSKRDNSVITSSDLEFTY